MADSRKLVPLDFERPIFEMEDQIDKLEEISRKTEMDLNGEVHPLKERLGQLITEIFNQLKPWQRIQIARHPGRPFTEDYIDLMVDDFVELHGDRSFRDDRAILTGLGKIRGRKVLIVGHRKGRDTKEKIACNFGCAHPEGYRKAFRKMQLAEKFGLPIVSLINTPGAYPGIGAEERGQAFAIAENLVLMAGLKVPIVSVVIGEGGSGGALGIGVGDRVHILEHAYYSVISPEGCAAILWKSAEKAPEAAEALRLTSSDLTKLGVVDQVVPEPLGGAHRRPEEMVKTLEDVVARDLDALCGLSTDQLLEGRYERFRRIGALFGDGPPQHPVVEEAAEPQDESENAPAAE